VTEPAKEDGLVRSGFALNAGRLLEQYTGLTRDMHPSQRFEATLTLSVLQLLLTNCWELYKYLGREHDRTLRGVYEFVGTLLVEPDVEVTSVFADEEVDGLALIEHLRNAVSHPTVRVAERPTTGYTTVEDGSGFVVRLRFTDSPDVSGKGLLRPGVEGDPRVFTIELPLSRLTALTQCVALVLAQPALDNWDGAELIRPRDLG
jgi:hypothetical protein